MVFGRRRVGQVVIGVDKLKEQLDYDFGKIVGYLERYGVEFLGEWGGNDIGVAAYWSGYYRAKGYKVYNLSPDYYVLVAIPPNTNVTLVGSDVEEVDEKYWQ